MKILALILFTSVSTFSQMQLSYNGTMAQFQGEIEVINRSAEELYQIATRWASRTYDNKARYSKIENEIIRGEGFKIHGVTLTPNAVGDMLYSWRINVQDGKVLLTISNMAVFTVPGTTDTFESFLYGKDGAELLTDLSMNVKQSFTRNANEFFKLLQNQYINP